MNTCSKEGYIYIIADYQNDAYKIGVTRNIASKRMKQLQTGNCNDLKLIKTFKSKYPFKLETLLHRTLNHKCIQNEWFALTQNDINNFETMCQINEDNIDMYEKLKQEELFFNKFL